MQPVRKQRRTPITQEITDEIIALYRQSQQKDQTYITLDDIGKRLNVGSATVSRIVKKYKEWEGTKHKRKQVKNRQSHLYLLDQEFELPEETQQEIIRLYEEDCVQYESMTVPDIARELKIQVEIVM